MNTTLTLRRHLAAVMSVALLAGMLGTVALPRPVLAGIASAACPFANVETATECQITVAWTSGGGGVAANNFPIPPGLPGPFAFHKTLRITGSGSIDATANVVGIPGPGITLNIDGAMEGAGGAGGALLMDSNAALLDSSDVAATNNERAGPITITTTGNVIMQAGSKIAARNTFGNGGGGAVKIDVNTPGTGVGTKMVLCGPTGSTDPGCGGAKNLPGAIIDVSNDGGSTAPAGSVTINVNQAPVGQFLMGGSTPQLAGAIVRANTSHGLAGSIDVTAGEKVVVEPGALVESVAGSGDSSHGGPISLISGCLVLVQGTVRSVGPDPGADLVHLEGCEVHVDGGQVYSQAHAHGGASGQCADNGHAPDGAVCVEIWGRHVTIDNGGQVWADFADEGGTNGSGWVDIYAEQDITIEGPPKGSPDEFGKYVPPSAFAVHSNGLLGNDTGGVITIKAQKSFITMSGRAVSADDYGNNSNGGKITVEAAGPVTLDGAVLSANGEFFGNPPDVCPFPSQGGGPCGDGGQITVRSWAPVIGSLSWTNGAGDARPVHGLAAITLSYCTTVDLTGTTFNNVLNNPLIVPVQLCAANQPTIPAYVIFNPGGDWNACGELRISGLKFNDLNNNSVNDGEPGLAGWTIHITGPNGFDTTVVTGVGGAYSVLLTGGPGVYTVCEVIANQAGWTQTFPDPGPGVVLCTGAGEAAQGYSVDTAAGLGQCCEGAHFTGRDFGNFQPSFDCPEDQVRTSLITRTVGKPSAPVPNYATLQAAYDAAKYSSVAEVIGMFSQTYENVVLNTYAGPSLMITQCTNAKITALDPNSPVWDIKSTKKLTIIGPDSVGGTIGWLLENQNSAYHDLKSIRSNGASVAGVRIAIGSNYNTMSFNNVASVGIGIDVLGNRNTLKSGTIGPSSSVGTTGTGVHFGPQANYNTISGSTIRGNSASGVWIEGYSNTVASNKVLENGPNGILVTRQTCPAPPTPPPPGGCHASSGSANTIKSNQVDSNGDGINVAGATNTLQDNKISKNSGDGIEITGTGNKLKSNASNNGSPGGSSENSGVEYRFGVAIVNQGSNKKDGSAFASVAAGAYE